MPEETNSKRKKPSVKNQLKFLYRLNKALYHDHDKLSRLNFNVLGHHYEIPASILDDYPDTLLGEATLRANYYDFSKDEFVFDRHPDAFESIVTFYESDGNSLTKPKWMPPEMFYEELKFYRFNSSILTSFYDQEIAPMIDIQIVPKSKRKRYLWLLLNYATQDWYSQLMCTIDFLINLIALWNFTRDCLGDNQVSQILYWIEDKHGQFLRPIYILFYLDVSNITIDLLCTIIFAVELCLRIYSAPTYYQAYSDVCFWFELTSLLSNILMYILVAMQQFFKIYTYFCLTATSILRSFRVLRFARQIIILKIFLCSLMHGTRELLNLFLIFTTIILFFGEFIYLIEEWSNNALIETVTDGYWLVALTITSLGYGDLYPTHIYSRILASICSMFGVIAIAITISDIYHYFNGMYQNEKRKRRIVRYIYSDQIALRI